MLDNMNRKNNNLETIAYLASFNKMFLSKDTFLIPYYLAKEQNTPLRVIYGSNNGDSELPKTYRGATLAGVPRRSVSKWNEIADWGKYILPKSRNIRSIFFCGCSAHHMILTILLLFLNKKANVIVFGDMEEPQARKFLETGTVSGTGFTAWIKHKLSHYFFNHVTFTVANEKAYILMEKAYKKYDWHGLASLHPCLDDELFHELGLNYRPWKEKDNIMVCVGRIGNYQKNTDMMLDAISKLDLRDWKVYFIGPITDSFEVGGVSTYKQKIDDWFTKYPNFLDKIIFTGMIYDQKIIFNYFLRAKIYVSSARHEGFANVYSQAAACGCFIVSTDVGGAQTASNNWKFGMKINQEDPDMMAHHLQMIIDDENVIIHNNQPQRNDFTYSKVIKKKLLNILN